jgi:hypothetical protein
VKSKKPRKPKRAPTWSLNQIIAAFRSVHVEVRTPYNPLPFVKTMADIGGINEFFEALEAQKKVRK